MLRLVDVSRYQVERADPLDLVKAKAAGYHIVNVALTGGRGYISGSWAAAYLALAGTLGMGRSVYHWLDGRTPGADQAVVQLERMRGLFGASLTGFGHFVDVEENGARGVTPPAWAHVRDYVTTMQAALGRPIGVYSGDWYWVPKGWNGASLTPYLMGMPNDRLGVTPDDDSPAWLAGWGGWEQFAVLQWGVKPLPGTGDCSLSVIRDHAVWAALTGGDVVTGPMSAANWVLVPCLKSLRDEFNALAPNRDKASDGSIGDTAHSQTPSDHNPDETGSTPFEDADNLNEVHAIDVDRNLTGSPLSMEQAVQIVVGRHRSGTDGRLQNVIFNRRVWSRQWGWTERVYTGSNAHTEHAHFSARYTTAQENDTSPWGLLEEDDDMATISQADFNARMDAWWAARMAPAAADNTARTALRVAPWHQQVGSSSGTRTYDVFMELRTNLAAVLATAQATLDNVVADDGDLAAIKAEIDARMSEAAYDVVEGLAASGVPDEEIAAALTAALGDRAPGIGRILAGS